MTERDQQEKTLEHPDYKGPEVRLCTDGKYRWTCPMNLLKNPSAYITVLKIFGILGGVAFLTINLGPLFRGEFAQIAHELKYWGIAVLVFLAISGVSYLIVAAMYKGKFIVQFTMDEEGILHEQIEEQKKNAKIIGGLVAVAGAASGKPGRLAQGAMVASHTSLSTDFAKVRSIKSYPRLNTIKVNAPLSKNQVYTTPEDYEFVLQYIKSHCPKAK